MASFKKELINSFRILPEIEGLENNKFIVYTAAGTFIGTPVNTEKENDSNSTNLIRSFTKNIAEDYRKDNNIPDDQPLDGNDGCFLLSDVTLITGNSRSNIPILAIFFDQVIGISIGNID